MVQAIKTLKSGMSGIGSKEKIIDKHYLVINYWDTSIKAAQTLLISGEKTLIEAFIKRNEKETLINETEKRLPQNYKMPRWAKVALIVILVLVLGLMFV